MRAMGGLLGAVVGGMIGAAIWGAIVYFTGYEIGWIAWGIGGLVGVGAQMGVRTGGGVPNATLPFMAAGVALLAVLAGKYSAVEIGIRQFEAGVAGNSAEVMFNLSDDEEELISYVADGIVVEYEGAGRSVLWPLGVDPDEAYEEADYPNEIWSEATQRWQAMSASERQTFADDINQETRDMVGEIASYMRSEGFIATFGLFDLLWFGLAMVTAWKIANDSE